MNTPDYKNAEEIVCESYKNFKKDLLGLNQEKTEYIMEDAFKAQARILFNKFWDLGYKCGSNHKDVDDILEGKA